MPCSEDLIFRKYTGYLSLSDFMKRSTEPWDFSVQKRTKVYLHRMKNMACDNIIKCPYAYLKRLPVAFQGYGVFCWMKLRDICRVTREGEMLRKARVCIVKTVASWSKVFLQCWFFQLLRGWPLSSGSLYCVVFTPTLLGVLQKRRRLWEGRWMVSGELNYAVLWLTHQLKEEMFGHLRTSPVL